MFSYHVVQGASNFNVREWNVIAQLLRKAAQKYVHFIPHYNYGLRMLLFRETITIKLLRKLLIAMWNMPSFSCDWSNCDTTKPLKSYLILIWRKTVCFSINNLPTCCVPKVDPE